MSNTFHQMLGSILPLTNMTGFLQVFHLTDKTAVFIYLDWQGGIINMDHVAPGGREIADQSESFLVDSYENGK